MHRPDHKAHHCRVPPTHATPPLAVACPLPSCNMKLIRRARRLQQMPYLKSQHGQSNAERCSARGAPWRPCPWQRDVWGSQSCHGSGWAAWRSPRQEGCGSLARLQIEGRGTATGSTGGGWCNRPPLFAGARDQAPATFSHARCPPQRHASSRPLAPLSFQRS